MFYGYIRGKYGLHSQIASDLFKDAVAILKNGGRAERVSIPFNIPRSGSLVNADRNASVNIAMRADIQTTDFFYGCAQLSDGNLPVNAGFLSITELVCCACSTTHHLQRQAPSIRAG